MISEPTCFKSSQGRCIDLILSTKSRGSFQKSFSFETGVSDHHHMICTMLRTTHTPLPPKKISSRSFRSFDAEAFKVDLRDALQEMGACDLSSFQVCFESVLDKHAPLKTKVLRGNHKPRVSKALRKANASIAFEKCS